MTNANTFKIGTSPAFEDLYLFFSRLQRIQQFSKTVADRRKRYQSRFYVQLIN